VYRVSICGGLELCVGGLSPPKLPRGDGSVYTTVRWTCGGWASSFIMVW